MPYFVFVVVLSNFVMLNLVVATLISTFDAQAAEARRRHREATEELPSLEPTSRSEEAGPPSIVKVRYHPNPDGCLRTYRCACL